MTKDPLLIYGAAFFRCLGVGLLGVLFALYLSLRNLDTGQIGLLVAAGLAGNVLGTLWVSFFADQVGRRLTLILLTALTLLGGVGLVLFPGFLGLFFLCLLGMVNAMGRERGALYTLEQAIIPQTTSDRQRTQALAWYNLVLDVGLALGSLLGALPFFFRRNLEVQEIASYQWTLALYIGFGILSIFLYMGLSRRIEFPGPAPAHGPHSSQGPSLSSRAGLSVHSRKIITRLSLLFGWDSLAGGFLPSSLIAYWFFKRFGLTEAALASLFFLAHVANALSYLGAAWVSKRIGLVRTMVVTHLPANVCLIAIPFVSNAALAVALYLLRECLVEMDVPTRQSYVMAMVAPHERTIASGVTNLTRLIAWSIAPGLAGYAMKGLSLSFPLFLGGGMKIGYDLSLYLSFRHLKPPEER